MGPLDYTTDVLNPIEGYMQGLKFGEGILTDRLNRDATTQNMGIQREQMDLAQAQFAAQERARAQQIAQQQAAQAAAQAQADAGREALFKVYDGLESGTVTTGDILRIGAAFPQIAEQLEAAKSAFSEERIATEIGTAQQMAYALSQGNVETAADMLRERQAAAEAAGDAQGAATYKAQLMQLEADPNAVQMQQLLALSSLMPNDEFETFTGLIGIGGDEEPTAGMREYEFARSQGYQGSFADWKASGAARTDIRVTTGEGEKDRYLYGTDAGLPAGYRLDRQTGEASPIPGGPVAIELAEKDEKSANTDSEGQLMMGTTLQSLNLNIAEIEDGGLPVTGAAGDARRTGIGRALTGSSAYDFGNRTNQITDSAALAEIQRMRNNSPTGGAVGALTDGERVAIGNAVTALNSSTSGEEYLRAARAYRDLSLDLAYGAGRWKLNDDGTVSAVGGKPAGGAKPPSGATSGGVTWSIVE